MSYNREHKSIYMTTSYKERIYEGKRKSTLCITVVIGLSTETEDGG